MTASARCMLVAAACVCVVPPVSTQHGNNRLVFAWERGGNIDLYLIEPGGDAPRRLTHDPAADELPRCSPDGRQVLFRRGGGTQGDLFMLDLATLEERRLTSDTTRDSNPQWSPDATTIYATKRIGGFDRIVSMDRTGGGMQVLSPAAEWHDVMPAISPDGTLLVHHTYRYGNEAELQLLDLRSKESRRLTDAPGNSYEASFAGNDAVVFSSNRAGGHYRIYRTSLRSNQTTMLADTGADAWGARYSPASGDVIFYTGKPGAWRMMTVNVETGSIRPLLDDGTSKSSADWCPARAR